MNPVEKDQSKDITQWIEQISGDFTKSLYKSTTFEQLKPVYILRLTVLYIKCIDTTYVRKKR